MRLYYKGERVDAHGSVDLMHLFSRLREEHFADLLIEADNASSICLFKCGDRALVKYSPSRNGDSYVAMLMDSADQRVEFRSPGKLGHKMPEPLTLPLKLAYQAVIHFVRTGGMTSALKWHEAA